MQNVYPVETTVGPFVFDGKALTVAREGVSVKLTDLEFRVLAYLTLRADTLVRKEDLYKDVWTAEPRPDPKIVDVKICTLRKKLARLGSNSDRHIDSAWGVGYTFCFVPQLDLKAKLRARAEWKAARETDPTRKLLRLRMANLQGFPSTA